MDPRIKAAVVTGWMTSLPTTLDLPNRQHGALFDAFSAHAHLDHPDIASLGAPACALFVQNCGQDRLFTRAGMDAAAEKLRAVYAALGRSERYRHRVYDVPHQFNAEMQEEAFGWLERHDTLRLRHPGLNAFPSAGSQDRFPTTSPCRQTSPFRCIESVSTPLTVPPSRRRSRAAC